MEDEGRLTVSSDFGKLLRRYRLAAGLSQEVLAERARMSSDGISALERGHRRTPQRETLALLVVALALSDEQRREFEAAAARPSLPRHGVLTVGPWADDGSAALPLALTSFVGREAELAEIAALVRAHRLVTITGAGGVGKTQIGLRVAQELNVADGVTVRFVGFAPIRDPSLLLAMIASALNVQEVPDRPLLATVIAYLKNRAMLLVFDNCEHVIAEAANIVGALLSQCPQVRVLATSRESLNTAGEYPYRLPSLDGSSAVMLFDDRARALDGHFALTEDSIAIVAEICRRLDGIPLAIELAAARVKVLSLKTLAEKLDDRFRILSGGDRTALPRQQTMRATIDWSYDLLAPQEQLLFSRLAVFSGSFSLDAVMAVCSEGIDESDIFDLVASLTAKSLVVADTSDPQERYRLLESTAAYALEKVASSGERERIARRHAEYFRERAEAADARFGTSSTVAWLACVELELDNYRAALEWALIRGNDVLLGGAIAGALQPPDVGIAIESEYWIALAVPRVSEGEHPAISARLQLALSAVRAGKGRYDSATRAIRLHESEGDLRCAARAQRLRAWALYEMGSLKEAREATAQALVAFRACGDVWGEAHCRNQLAIIEGQLGNLGTAQDLYAQALAGNQALGDEMGISQVLGNMAESAFAMHDYVEALRLVDEALELASLGKNLALKSLWRRNRAAYCIALSDFEAARESAREALHAARHIGRESDLADAIQHLALVAALENGDTRCAAHLLGFVDAEYRRSAMQRELTEKWSYEKLMAVLHEQLNDAQIENLAAEGAAWSEDRAVEEALKV